MQVTINEDQQLIVREPETNLRIPKSNVSEILTQHLGLQHVAAKSVVWFLLPEQKEHRG